MGEEIVIKGARLNNLKNIDLTIPRGKFVVITGVSGSGKSTLAFDTLFAEGQRRYVESLSSFARQFLGRMTKPDADEISGIPPAIAIEQKVSSSNPRSTVGSVSEISYYLRVLYSKIGESYSPISGERVKRDSTADMLQFILSQKGDDALYILAPIELDEQKMVETLLALRDEGFSRVWQNGELITIESLFEEGSKAHKELFTAPLFLLVDRVFSEDERENKERILDSLNMALNVNRGRESDQETLYITYLKEGQTLLKRFSTLFERDGIVFEEPSEQLFNSNNPLGACVVCSGYGQEIGIDPNKVIPDESLSLYNDAVACWRGESMSYYKEQFIKGASSINFPIHRPYGELSKEQKELLWNGYDGVVGVEGFFKILEENRYKIQNRFMISRFSGKRVCSSCGGKRLRKEALYVKLGGEDIASLFDMSIERLYTFILNLKLTPSQHFIAKRILVEIESRLRRMVEMGLSYLTLNRQSRTLSGGESQRLNLVSSLGSNLTGSLYILDEPSIGLHSKDSANLIKVLKELRELGNSLLVVEHDEEIMRAADLIIDIGPGAGSYGGEITYLGTPNYKLKVGESSRSVTLQYLSGIKSIPLPPKIREWREYIEVEGATHHNLKGISVKFPLGVLTAVTGVSGSGKSSLVGDILYPALNRKINSYGDLGGAHKKLSGALSKIGAVEFIDQNPIGKSSRSNPATYLKVYDEIRKLFSEQPYAKANGYGHSHFSFNIDGGRCPECEGEGVIKIEMQFMADVTMVCDSCGGKRFKPDILEVKYRGKNINDVLKMRVDEAIEFFKAQKDTAAQRVAEKLKPLQEVGLSYVQLGQSSSTLSGGESQRVKLASFLSKESSRGSTLFIFDEPTTGLHLHDIGKLLNSFNALIDRGNSVVVVEHNLEVIKSADWVIDLGPEGGERGGYLLFEGSPRDMVNSQESYTAKALRPYFIKSEIK